MPSEKTSYHHGDLRRAVLDACFELLEEGGVQAVVMAKAARKAGVSSGAPYRHFKDRADLLAAMGAEASQQFRHSLDAAAAGQPGPTEAFRAVGIEYVRWASENPALYRLMTEPEVVGSTANPEEAAMWAGLASLMDSGQPVPTRHPLIVQIAGRALAHGLASMFADGILPTLGVDPRHAERLTELVTEVTAIGSPEE
ncbi:MAG: TetR/AcrR family transcriptional regulator [Deltaproteobacteria bacterium]|nr:TetR/AcrR family transcriptional regulator [Deltaproteobacteria bacterium]